MVGGLRIWLGLNQVSRPGPQVHPRVNKTRLERGHGIVSDYGLEEVITRNRKLSGFQRMILSRSGG